MASRASIAARARNAPLHPTASYRKVTGGFRGAEQFLLLVSWCAHDNYVVVPAESGPI
ncbi:hypothetical protein SBA1_1180008 [Candidatus Sulfotelmatobacter kueseliae]|uniref:Uncharacterized protein n=1 Tax=Candidatus Sulfotelmatobacter kueseliae TaxID=2042962 RepID=A0A2U3K1B1_9BACT|nr:hypothetical protein SBA1_1180008 [Candidatus Sulfotelmatobacter kueseliae]